MARDPNPGVRTDRAGGAGRIATSCRCSPPCWGRSEPGRPRPLPLDEPAYVRRGREPAPAC